MQNWLTGLRLSLWLTVLTGALYPLLLRLVAQGLFPVQATGNLLLQGEKVRGAALIGQPFSSSHYFWSRPSAVDYNALASGGSNLAATSGQLQQHVHERQKKLLQAHSLAEGTVLPADLLYASASGLDPHISPKAAQLQVQRVAKARGFSVDQRTQLASLVDGMTEGPQWGFIGMPRVHVLRLNLALDAMSGDE